MSPLDGIAFQRFGESRAFELGSGNGNGNATGQLVGDFIQGTASIAFGRVLPSCKPAVKLTDLAAHARAALPDCSIDAVHEALPAFERQINGFSMQGAMLTGVETRTSSSRRITRGRDLQCVNVKGPYPAGEGAGYASGIMSAGVASIEVAEVLGRDLLAPASHQLDAISRTWKGLQFAALDGSSDW